MILLAVLLIFLGTMLATLVLLGLLFPAPSPHVARIRALAAAGRAEVLPARPSRKVSHAWALIERVAGRLGQLTTFDAGKAKSKWGKRLVQAGYRSARAPEVFHGIRIGLAVLLPLALLVVPRLSAQLTGPQLPALLLFLVAVGLFLPHWVLRRQISKRQEEITDALPNALDLMVICVEAGLGLDATFQRLAQERQFTKTALSQEFQLVVQETRAGRARAEALLGLKERVGLAEVSSLVLTLIQAERMGTGIGRSLRVYADTFRTKRRQRAEERAAKVPVKMIFPLVLLIFPATLVVLLGPSYILIYKALLALKR